MPAVTEHHTFQPVDRRVNPKTQARVGRSVDLAIDVGGFHFFDMDTGRAIGRVTEGEGARDRREALDAGQADASGNGETRTGTTEVGPDPA
jgi:hypothetical protein